MGVGVGGLITGLMGGDPSAQLGQALAGPSPNPQQAPVPAGGPQSPAGGPPAPGGPNAAPSSPAQPPAQTYAPDPTNAATIQLLLKVHQQDATSAAINKNLDQIASGFGTAQQQASKTANLASDTGGYSDTLAALAGIQKIQAEKQAQDEHNKFMAGAAGLAKILPGVDSNTVVELANSGHLPDILASHFRDLEPTTQQRDADAATNAYAQGRGYDLKNLTPAQQQDVASYKANLLAGAMGGSDLEQRQYLQEKSSGVTTDDFATWKAKHAAAATAMSTQAKDVQDFKDTATQDYTKLNQSYSHNRQLIDQLLSNVPATISALRSVTPTTGVMGAVNPLHSQAVANAAIALNTLKASLSGAALTDVKNVRNQREFNSLAQAATGSLDPANSDATLTQALQDLKNKFLDAQATAEMSVGHKLTGDLVGHGNRDLLDPKSPYYNGATEEAPIASGAPSDAIAHLKANPSLAAAFDQKYGQGASKRILGH